MERKYRGKHLKKDDAWVSSWKQEERKWMKDDMVTYSKCPRQQMRHGHGHIDRENNVACEYSRNWIIEVCARYLKIGISQANLNKIQRIQNTLARVVTNTSKFEHITPILKKLHWLPIKQRIDYKLCLLTYKTLQIQQPTYLYNSLSFPSHSLSTRSSDSSVLSIPYVRTSLGKRAFSVIAPRLWNSLPPDTRNSLSVSTFRSKLKTHLFKLAFPLEFSPILSSDCLPGFDSCFSFTFSPIEWYLVLDTGH